MRALLLLASLVVAVVATGCDSSSTRDDVPLTTSFNVSVDGCQNADTRAFRRVALTDHAAVWADEKNPLPTLSDAEFQAIADSFEAIVWPTNTRIFGSPTDIDGNGRVHILYTTAVNDLSPSNSASYIGGFFYSRDLFPRAAGRFNGLTFNGSNACPTSNQGEVFYMLAPDENGTVKGNVRTKALVRRVTLGTIAHEFQHLINASNRLYRANTVFEDTWLDEGLSHVAEEVNFFAAGASAPGQNYDVAALRANEARRLAYNKLMAQNTARYNDFLKKGATASPYDSNDSLATRGGAWAFLRYAADRRGGDQEAFFRALAQSGTRGMASVQKGLSVDPYPWVADFHVATVADDRTATTAAYQMPSWNMRDILGTLFGGYGLQQTPLAAGVTARATVDGGGAAHFALAVPAAASGTVQVGEAGLLPIGTCASGAQPVDLAVGGVYTASVGPAALCLSGGASGAEYVVTAAHTSPAPTRNATSGDVPDNERLTLHVRALGITTPVLALPPVAGAAAGVFDLHEGDFAGGAIEQDIRRRERALQQRLLGHRLRPALSVQGASSVAQLRVLVLRTK